MARIEVTRTELVWPGKYDEHGGRVAPARVSLPFQTVETINETRATRESTKRPEQISLFDVWSGDKGDTFEKGWRNKLIWGDNLLVMSSLLDRFAGKVDLIYIDPPFATGADFALEVQIGEGDAAVVKDQSIIEEKAYRDYWSAGRAGYLATIVPRLQLMKELLAPAGSIFVHVDWHVAGIMRLALDEIFGPGRFVNEIIWAYKSMNTVRRFFPRKHDNIFWYANGPTWPFNWDHPAVQTARTNTSWFTDEEGKHYWLKGGRRYYLKSEGKVPEDYWTDIPSLHGPNQEQVGFLTQKPLQLLSRIIASVTNPGDLVADFFVGSGTTAVAAELLGRRWMAADFGRYGIHLARKRLLELEGCKPFDLLNLGKYERQFWQAASFGGREAQRVLYEYISFILRLYGAEPLTGLQYLHGKRQAAMIHVGAVDAPITIAEVTDALDECVATAQVELHVLGWEWEMGLNDLVNQLAQERRVRLKLLAIPREVMERQAVEKGDIRFFELAHLDCQIETASGRSLTVELTDFAMSDADAIDQEVRARITKWSDFVDYWAIDFDFRNDTFMNGWVAYRTRKERRLALRSELHHYPAAGNYRIAVKVVDIFGNDTTRVFPVEVR